LQIPVCVLDVVAVDRFTTPNRFSLIEILHVNDAAVGIILFWFDLVYIAAYTTMGLSWFCLQCQTAVVFASPPPSQQLKQPMQLRTWWMLICETTPFSVRKNPD
jgi:hypothetical protein